MGNIYDITIPMHSDMPAFPGDEKVFEIYDILKVEQGDAYTIRKIKLLTHTGTHIDAPSHFIPHGRTLDQLDLSKFTGKAMVVKINNQEKVSIDEVGDLQIEPDIIILFKTRNSQIWKENKNFEEKYVYVTPETAQFLVEKKVKAVGIDYLSIDKYGEEVKPLVHLKLLENDIPIIEGLNLSEVSEGLYRFTCLPLKMIGVDGSPARAILEDL
ncbi:MAG: cyclase family protein [Cyanobacteriota bacterium]